MRTRITPERVESLIRREHAVPMEARAAQEQGAVDKRRSRAAMVAFYTLLVFATLGATSYLLGQPIYAFDHSTASIEMLREDAVRHVDPARRRQAIKLLEVRARDAISALRAAESGSNVHLVEEALERIRAEAR